VGYYQEGLTVLYPQVKVLDAKKNVVQPGHVRILHWDSSVVVRRASTRKIPTDTQLIAQAKVGLDENKVIDAVTIEQILDKMIYHYFHFLMSGHQETKSHYYNNYLALTTAMSKLGHPQEHFRETKAIALEKKKIADQVLKSILSQKDEVPGLLEFRDLSRQYEQFKNKHTAYGENVDEMLSGLAKHWNLQLY
jgi:hypothetical protein